MSKFQPRPGDLNRTELVKRANDAIKTMGEDVEVHFKFTCPECGTRCTLEKPNMLYENGECHQCGKTSPIEFGGFTLKFVIGGHKNN